MAVMVLFHLPKMFSFQYFLKRLVHWIHLEVTLVEQDGVPRQYDCYGDKGQQQTWAKIFVILENGPGL